MKVFLAGVGIGTVVGLSIAPLEGTKNRAALASYGVDLFNFPHKTKQSPALSGIAESVVVAEVLNTASKHDLMSVDGIGKGTAKRIVTKPDERRPKMTERALASKVFSLPTLILICLGLASAFLASLIFSTPLS